jgi:outer membrane lipoprotein-sorting protein
VNPKLVTGVSFSILLIIISASMVDAAAPEQKGLEIALESDRRDSGFVNYTVDLKMLLKSRKGQERVRELRLKILEVEKDGDKSVAVFDTPKDVKGTAFLSFSHKLEDDEQWLYLPALKRVKRIASRNRSSPFMGSEFSYEDMASQEVEKYTYKWLKEEVYNGMDSFVIERYPVDRENSGYERQVTWIDKEKYRIKKIEFFDRKNSLLKTLTIGPYEQFEKKFWKPLQYNMVNHQTGKSTVLKFDNYRFGVDLDDRDFTKNSLVRAR